MTITVLCLTLSLPYFTVLLLFATFPTSSPLFLATMPVDASSLLGSCVLVLISSTPSQLPYKGEGIRVNKGEGINSFTLNNR